MNRIIKFRIWDKIIEKMMPYYWFIQFDNPDYEFMQFTGLYDKNGKEIYEGDLIMIDEFGPYKVFWEECAWRVAYYSEIDLLTTYDDFETVGHIFDENLDLKIYKHD